MDIIQAKIILLSFRMLTAMPVLDYFLQRSKKKGRHRVSMYWPNLQSSMLVVFYEAPTHTRGRRGFRNRDNGPSSPKNILKIYNSAPTVLL